MNEPTQKFVSDLKELCLKHQVALITYPEWGCWFFSNHKQGITVDVDAKLASEIAVIVEEEE